MSKWDDICSQCGLCCYHKYSNNGNIEINLAAPCRYLDTKTNKCTVYENRFIVEPKCKKVNLFRVLFSPYLPSTCSYVRKFRKIKTVEYPVFVSYELDHLKTEDKD